MARNLNLQIIAALARADLKTIKERDFSIAVREFAEAHGWLVEYRYRSATKLVDGSWRGTGPKGFPDLFMCREADGRAIAAELKSQGGNTTPEQRKWLSLLAGVKDGAISTYVWKPVDAGEAMKVLK